MNFQWSWHEYGIHGGTDAIMTWNFPIQLNVFLTILYGGCTIESFVGHYPKVTESSSTLVIDLPVNTAIGLSFRNTICIGY